MVDVHKGFEPFSIGFLLVFHGVLYGFVWFQSVFDRFLCFF